MYRYDLFLKIDLRIRTNQPIHLYMNRPLKWLVLSLATGIFSSCTLNDPYSPGHQYSRGNPYGTPYGKTDPNNPHRNNNGGSNSPYANQQNPYGGSNSPYGREDPFSSFGGNDGLVHQSNDFPYELIPDTVTALTCPHIVNINNKTFTLTMGAYYDHGLQLSEDFIENNRLENSPPAKVRQVLDSSLFKNARARIALQDESNLDIISSVQGQALVGLFPPLNNPSTLTLLSELRSVFTSRSSYSSRVQNSGKFSASLPLSGQQLVNWAPALAENTQGSLLLTLTYTLDGKRSIYSPERTPYGRGYKLEFGDPYRADYLIDVKEENLATTRREGDWTCPSDLRFMVHRATSANASPFNRTFDTYKHSFPEGTLYEGYCYTGDTSLANSRMASDFFIKEFGTDRINQLPFEVGTTMVFETNSDGIEQIYTTDQPCIKFRRPTCYDERQFYRLEFDPEKQHECTRELYFSSTNASNEELFKTCPAFLSVCYRRTN